MRIKNALIVILRALLALALNFQNAFPVTLVKGTLFHLLMNVKNLNVYPGIGCQDQIVFNVPPTVLNAQVEIPVTNARTLLL